ncbi:MAG TPA: hypothetical protein DEO70_12100 [Bacteroidales bacterium]|nr:MAG: hypothetical protein A2X11_10090 [Bacteroidetes bacterium GWE2_42_24]OFY25862.1 MAG: hypothetical protein A2X09_09465 [Bacteroidetes bacterium GWF2_43_11]HBZ67570.1 hypothetical protein [Bacteroidales bacterium]
MENKKITIAVMDYSKSPGPRYSAQGDDSGEDFYHKILNEKFKYACDNKLDIEINLDGPDGYASSFLDEAFGNLVFDFGKEDVKNRVTIISNEEPEWIEMIINETYNEWEERRIANDTPTKTAKHEAWWRLNYNNLLSKEEWVCSI